MFEISNVCRQIRDISSTQVAFEMLSQSENKVYDTAIGTIEKTISDSFEMNVVAMEIDEHEDGDMDISDDSDNNDRPTNFINPNSEWTEFSEILGQRVTYVDVFFLYFDIMRLYVQEHQFISENRKLAMLDQIKYMEESVKIWRDQGRWQLLSGIGAGLMGVMSGLLPIVGKMKGDSIINALSSKFSYFEKFQDKPWKFFEFSSKISEAGGRMYESTGRVHQSFSEGTKSRSDFNKEKMRTEADEELRRRDDANQNFREFKNTLKDIFDQVMQVDQQLFNSTR